MCRFISVLILVVTLTMARKSRVEAGDEVTPLHLVGHEDIALLDRVQDLIDDWDSRKLVNPVFETLEVRMPDGSMAVRKVLKRPDLAEFIADVDAAEALGKAFFWDMQSGSDFRRLADGTTFVGTACTVVTTEMERTPAAGIQCESHMSRGINTNWTLIILWSLVNSNCLTM